MADTVERTRRAWRYLLRKKYDLPPEWQTFDGFVEGVGYAPSNEHRLVQVDVKKPRTASNLKWIDPAKGKGELVLHQRFGRLTVVDVVPTPAGCQLICLCDCGEYTKVGYCSANRGQVRSCGCLRQYRAARMNRSHGMTSSATYRVWQNMLAKCRSKCSLAFKEFGGRGIKVCDRWRDFSNFLMDMGVKPDGLYINRRDKDGDFTPENCFWSEFIDSRRLPASLRSDGIPSDKRWRQQPQNRYRSAATRANPAPAPDWS